MESVGGKLAAIDKRPTEQEYVKGVDKRKQPHRQVRENVEKAAEIAI
jgi:hypothetical protein